MGREGNGQQLVELRRYSLRPGTAAAFVEHFERHFLASQEAHGMDVVGQFTVPGDDARFVWVRRFLRPAERGAALRAFYSGPPPRRGADHAAHADRPLHAALRVSPGRGAPAVSSRPPAGARAG
jgi:hypothetical protein